jgi:hypothetical protein
MLKYPEEGTREREVLRWVGLEIEDALYDFTKQLDKLVQRKRYTEEEITAALKWSSDEFQNAWHDYITGGD